MRSSGMLADSEGLVSFKLTRIDGQVDEAITGTMTLAGNSVYFTPSAPLAPAARRRQPRRAWWAR